MKNFFHFTFFKLYRDKFYLQKISVQKPKLIFNFPGKFLFFSVLNFIDDSKSKLSNFSFNPVNLSNLLIFNSIFHFWEG